MKCPLCRSKTISDYYNSKKTSYIQCSDCSLVFIPRDQLLSNEEEHARYELHDNSITNNGYVKYLSKIADKLEALNLTQLKILDFGSGKNAVLETVLHQRNIKCYSYDPLYDLGNSNLKFSYGVIVVCEVIEHIYNIYEEINLLSSLLDRGGYLLLRTELLLDNTDFSSWWYKEDVTHVNFFTPKAINKVVELIGGEVVDWNGNIIVIKKLTA